MSWLKTATVTSGWISPDGRIYEAINHKLFMKEHPDLFGIDPKEAKRMGIFSEFGDAYQIAFDHGWIRFMTFGGELFVTGPDLSTIKRNSEELLFSLIHTVSNVVVDAGAEESYEFTMKEFNEKGWDALGASS